MSQRKTPAELRALLKKQIAALTIFALGFSLLGVISAPKASAANYVAGEIKFVAFGRAGGTISLRVQTTVPAGTTSVADQVAVEVVSFDSCNSGCSSGTNVTQSMFATTQTVGSLQNDLAKYDFSIPAPSVAGAYYVKACAHASTTPLTYSTLNALTDSINSICTSKWVMIGGAPTKVVFSHKSLSANSVSGYGSSSANAEVMLFDANGVPTKLKSPELLTLTSTSAALSSSYGISYNQGSGNIPVNNKVLTFDQSSGDGDGVYRFVLTDANEQSSVINSYLENSLGAASNSNPVSNFSFNTRTFSKTGYPIKLLPSQNYYDYRQFASGTDGKLYYWGSGIGPSFNKPIKVDFIPRDGNVSNTTVAALNLTPIYSTLGGSVVSSDGSLYSISAPRISNLSTTTGPKLVPLFYPSLMGIRIVDASTDYDTTYLLDSTGRVWKKFSSNYNRTTDYALVDLSIVGSPRIQKLAFTGSTIFLLTESGTVISQGSNESGILGQGINTSPTVFGQISFPDSDTIQNLYASSSFAFAIGRSGKVWTWGSNSYGQLAKDTNLISSSNAPILAIMPVGIEAIQWNLLSERISFLASDKRTIYVGSPFGGWVSLQLDVASNTFSGSVSTYTSGTSFYSYLNYGIMETSDGRIYSNSRYSIGNCTSSGGYVRSVGQFGPVSTDDALVYSGIFLQNDSSTTSVGTTISLKVNETATLQVVQPRSSCYGVSELTYLWDLDGTDNYAVPGTSSLSQTGYKAFNATLNFASAGRKEVKLKLSTPDGLDLVLKFTVGVEPRIAPVIDFGETRTGLISSSNDGALGIGTDGRLYTWGSNNFGQLSAPTSLYSNRRLALPVDLPNGAKPRTVSTFMYDGYYSTNMVVDTSGKVWGAGNGYSISGNYGTVDTFTLLSHLSSFNIVDVQSINNKGFALTRSGQILMWSLGTTGPAKTPYQIVSLSGINIKNFTVQYGDNGGIRISAVDTDGYLWLVPITSNGAPGDATKVTSFSDIRQLAWNGAQAVIVTGSGGVWYSVSGASPFAQVTLPVGVTAVDAMYSNTLYLLDSTKKIWTANPSQSGNTITMSTWTAYAAQANGQASASDQPILQHRGSAFISFESGNLLYTGGYSSNPAGRCNVYNGSNNGNRVYSTGQFGVANIIDQINTSATVAIASQNAASFTNGQFFSANPGDAVVIRLVNPTSGCFTGSSQLTAVADTAGSGNYNTAVPLSNEGGGTYSFTLSGTAPTSGRKSISVRISTPLGTSSIFSLGLGVFGTETITAIVPRTNPVNTSQAAVFAVASDGYAYGWSTPTDVSYDYNGTTVSFMNMITTTPPRNSGSPTKLELPGGVRVREAVPFTSCCTNNYGRYIFGVLVVDEYGRTWTWGSDSNLRAANGYAYQSTPLTPTQIPALVGENVIRLSVSPDGRRALALTSKGIVYQWFYSSSVTPTRVASLAGLNITDIQANNYISYAITETGQLYAFNGPGYLAGVSATGNSIYDALTSATQVNISETVTAIMPLADPELTAAKTSSGNVYLWGELYSSYNGINLQILTPTRVNLPNSRTASLAGTVNYSSYSSNVVTASDGTWWDIALNAQGQLTYFQRSGVASEVRSSVRAFASGAGQAMVLNSGAIYTTNYQIAGTCGPIGTYTRVMSTGQFGPLYKADQIYINVDGNEITRPNTATSVSVTGWSACDGGANITMTADYIGNNIYGDTRTATVSQDGSRATSTFTFTKTQNGPVYMHFKATTAAGLSGTETFFTKVVPAPLPGRQIGISINAGDRYTNSSNVSLSLVWPDGTTKIYVSNDGGFAPGTVSDYDLQYTVPWVLPPQAVIPLPSIVYARFDNDPNTYYFDDIILDAITPVLTYASAR